MMAESTLPNQIHSLCQIHSAKSIMQFGRVNLADDPKPKFGSQSASVGVIVCFIKTRYRTHPFRVYHRPAHKSREYSTHSKNYESQVSLSRPGSCYPQD